MVTRLVRWGIRNSGLSRILFFVPRSGIFFLSVLVGFIGIGCAGTGTGKWVYVLYVMRELYMYVLCMYVLCMED